MVATFNMYFFLKIVAETIEWIVEKGHYFRTYYCESGFVTCWSSYRNDFAICQVWVCFFVQILVVVLLEFDFVVILLWLGQFLCSWLKSDFWDLISWLMEYLIVTFNMHTVFDGSSLAELDDSIILLYIIIWCPVEWNPFALLVFSFWILMRKRPFGLQWWL